MRILVVDDEPFALKMLVRQLENLGYTDVMHHQRGHDALGSLEAAGDAVGLIFCDLQMPGMDGVEFVRQLVRLRYAGALVLVSGEDERILQAAERLARAHKLDVLGALRKPVFPEHLQRVLESNLLRASAAGSRSPRRQYDPAALQRAILNGELINHYQPKIHVATAVVIGVEALARWRHPDDGLIFPNQFIGLAEEHGLIDDLTRAVLTAAVRQAREWRDTGLDLHVAINVSMRNLCSLEFPDFVADVANSAQFPVHSIVLEVTESQAMQDPLTTLDILTRLRLKRIGLSIDDFGTGHSTLAQLRDLPFEELKVDRGFVHGAWRDPSLRAIFEASLRMARQMRMQVVGEGVEDRDDWAFLRSTGCEMAQGYFIAKPMPAERLPDWILGWDERRQSFLGTRR